MFSIRERTREVAVLHTLGFAPRITMSVLIGESLVLCLASWVLASVGAFAIVYTIVHTAGGGFQTFLKLRWPTVLICLAAAMINGVMSAVIPAHRSSHCPIAEALRYIG